MISLYRNEELNNHWLARASYHIWVKDWYLKLGYVFLQQVDLLLTMLAMHTGLYELNPFVQSLLNTPQKLVIFKVIIPPELKEFLPADYTRKNLDIISKRGTILKELGLKAAFWGKIEGVACYFPNKL